MTIDGICPVSGNHFNHRHNISTTKNIKYHNYSFERLISFDNLRHYFHSHNHFKKTQKLSQLFLISKLEYLKFKKKSIIFPSSHPSIHPSIKKN